MGPLAPDIISPEMNLILGLLLGIAFGFVLEQAGFSSCRKLTGLFYGTDFTVLRVFFTAGVTAMSGVLILNHLGLLDMDIIYINPTFVQSALAGGAVMGLGFILGGYCPGTSVCGAAVGKVDGMVFVLGGIFGIWTFGEFYEQFLSVYTGGSFGDLLVSDALGVSQGVFALGLIAMAVAAFIATTWIERRVNPESESRRFPVRWHRRAAVAVLILGVILAALPDRKKGLLAKAADPQYRKSYPVPRMPADELAFYLLDGGRQVTPVDVRDAALFAKTSLPGAVNIQPGAMFGKEGRDALGQEKRRKVFFAENEEEGVRAATLARLLGYGNIAVLEGGLSGFTRTILQGNPGAGLDEATARFRQRAGVEIAALIKQRGGVRTVRKIKRVQGGCGS